MPRAAGFTLIELLIVIAIIGILAAVLIPNLLKARSTASKRAAQLHSASVYEALAGQLASDTNATPASVLTLYGGNCRGPQGVDSTHLYGWAGAPSATNNCVIALNAASSDFVVTETMDVANGGQSTVNGGPLQ